MGVRTSIYNSEAIGRTPFRPVTAVVVVIQSLSCVRLFETPWTSTCQVSMFLTIFWSLLTLMSVESMKTSNHLILCCPLSLQPSIFPSNWAFSSESAPHLRWPKYWSFSFSISISVSTLSFSSYNVYSGLVSFRIDYFNRLAVQGTAKRLLQHHSSKASILWLSAFFMVQLSHPYMTTGKTIAWTIWIFVSQVMFCFLIRCLGLS